MPETCGCGPSSWNHGAIFWQTDRRKSGNPASRCIYVKTWRFFPDCQCWPKQRWRCNHKSMFWIKINFSISAQVYILSLVGKYNFFLRTGGRKWFYWKKITCRFTTARLQKTETSYHNIEFPDNIFWLVYSCIRKKDCVKYARILVTKNPYTAVFYAVRIRSSSSAFSYLVRICKCTDK